MMNAEIKMLFKFVAIKPTTLEIALITNAITMNPARKIRISVSTDQIANNAFTLRAVI